MTKRTHILLCLLILGGLASCDIPAPFGPAGAGDDIEQQHQVISALLTKTAQAAFAVSAAPEIGVKHPDPTSTQPAKGINLPTITYTPAPVVIPKDPPVVFTSWATLTPVPAAHHIQALPCDFARPDRPMDITVPDETRFYPGEFFSKTWRLVNAGNCTWTRDYSVVWFSGNDLGITRVQPMNAEVKPGDSLDVTVDMIAPRVPGVYQSNWKISGKDGGLFGIGPNGDAPFWVRIIVVPQSTSTATAVPLPTETPVVYTSGTLTLVVGDGVDFDDGLLNQAEKDDLLLKLSAEGWTALTPVNGARVSRSALVDPALMDCQLSGMDDTPLELNQVQDGSYLCYRTSGGLPGRVLVKVVNQEEGIFSLEFLTWAVP